MTDRLTPMPHQIVGAQFLVDNPRALLADEPRVGKTGAAIMALDGVGAKRTLVVTTASGRPVWRRAFEQWSWVSPDARVAYSKPTAADVAADRLIVSWDGLTRYGADLPSYDTVILDESHYAKSWGAKRTQAAYGEKGAGGVCAKAERVWCLSGTPMPNGPHEMHPMLRALAPDRLDVLGYDEFLRRYCITRPKRLSRWNTIQVVVGHRNMDDLKARLAGFWLRRTQADIGIREPIFEVLPIHITAAERREVEASLGDDARDILDAAETLETQSLEMHMGPMRRVTGGIKARGVAQVVKDEFAGGLDKVVLMCWHKDVMDFLAAELSKYGVVRVDGSTSPYHREQAQEKFRSAETRVFIGQIIAAGEAIDLSAAADLIFVESSFVPKDMKQAALRITNVAQTRQCRVRVAALEGSIDEALQTILTRKVATIKEILS